MKQELLKVEDVASMFHVTKRTIYNWNNLSIGPRRIKVGKQVFYRACDVETYIKELASR